MFQGPNLFCRDVTVLDIAYWNPKLGVVGDSYSVDIELVGLQDEFGMLFDFGPAKKQVKSIIDHIADHCFVVPAKMVQLENQNAVFSANINEKYYYYQAPQSAFCLLSEDEVNKENIENFLKKELLKQLPGQIIDLNINLKHEDLRDNPFYHYTHGLKNHQGNCQRIFHGHRNKIDIYVNQEKNHELEKYVAHELFQQNIHFCIWENIENKKEISKVMGQTPVGKVPASLNVELSYESAQGRFTAKLPGADVYITPIETTVENLAFHFAELVSQKMSSSARLKVYAFEGIGKGASVERKL